MTKANTNKENLTKVNANKYTFIKTVNKKNFNMKLSPCNF